MSLYEEDLFNDSTLKAYYRFESGALTTDSKSGHTLTAIDSPASTTGRFGGGVLFDGNNDAYSADDHADFKPSGDFSVGAWIKTASFPGSGTTIFQSRYNLASPAKYYGLWLNLYINGYIRFGSAKGTGTTAGVDYQYVESNIPISSGSWQFIVGVWDSFSLKIYINGTLHGTAAWANAPAWHATNVVRIGCQNVDNSTNSMFLTAAADDLFLFNGKALIASEVESLYYHFKDASLNLTAYAQNLVDLEMYLRAHDGLEFRDFRSVLQAINGIVKVIDASFSLAAKGQKIEALMSYLYAAKEEYKELAMYLAAANGSVLRNMAAYLTATDGNVLKDFGMYLQVLSAVPAFRSVTAHRINSVIHEVV